MDRKKVNGQFSVLSCQFSVFSVLGSRFAVRGSGSGSLTPRLLQTVETASDMDRLKVRPVNQN
jgi:hypothetical protein